MGRVGPQALSYRPYTSAVFTKQIGVLFSFNLFRQPKCMVLVVIAGPDPGSEPG